jgi:protein-S-isoprenylcysteine O-methyltransferase Ste14
MRRFTELGGWWVAAQFLLFGAIAVALFVWGGDWGWPSVVVGVVLVVGGLTLAGAGMVTLGDNLSPFPAPRTDGVLVERGVYRVVRHPIYGGLVLGSIGLSLADGNAIALGITVILAVLLTAKSAGEERRLEAHLAEYVAYRKRVRWRIIPWVV